MGWGLCEGGSEESVARVLARYRPGEGVTGWAEEARPAGESPAANGASSMRGRRGDGGGDWGRRTGGVNATWGNEPLAASIGEKDPARIERAREGFQTGAGLGSTRQSITAQGGVTFFIGSKLQKVELHAKMCKHQTFRGKSVYNFRVWNLVWIITVFDKNRSEVQVCKLTKLIQLRFQFW